MPARLTSRVTFANGIAAEGVRVSIFDQDAPEKHDDDLTITPGLSNREGVFSLEYDPSGYQDASMVTISVPRNPPFDWTLEEQTHIENDREDKYQPYLSFKYILNGQEITHTVGLKSGYKTYELPNPNPIRFVPTQHGWHFPNYFQGFFLPFALPMIPGLSKPGSVYGLCGGMSAGALDFFLNNHPTPPQKEVPANGTPLQQYLYKRQLDSMGTFGDTILRFHQWMGLPDDTPLGTQKLTLDEFEKKIRPRLNNFLPTPIGMLYVKWQDSHEVWLNHQVLAVRYERISASRLNIAVYDPNYPNRDDVIIEAEKVDVGGQQGMRLIQRIGAAETKKLYGIFAVPYKQAIPPDDIS